MTYDSYSEPRFEPKPGISIVVDRHSTLYKDGSFRCITISIVPS